MLDCLIVGGTCSIGRSVARRLHEGGKSVAWTSRRRNDPGSFYLDLESLAGLADLPRANHVVLVAAQTKFEACACNPELTHRINVEAPAAVANQAIKQGARVLFLSSIAVHGGSVDLPDEGATPTPNSVYGVQKLEAEDRLAALGGQIIILRLSRVVTPDFQLFSDWLTSLMRNEMIAPFDDMLVAPVSLDLVTSVAADLLCGTNATGIFQLSAREQISYATIAQWLAAAIKADSDLISPSSALASGNHIWLPKFARLNCSRLTAELGIRAPAARDAVDYFMATAGHRGDKQK